MIVTNRWTSSRSTGEPGLDRHTDVERAERTRPVGVLKVDPLSSHKGDHVDLLAGVESQAVVVGYAAGRRGDVRAGRISDDQMELRPSEVHRGGGQGVHDSAR